MSKKAGSQNAIYNSSGVTLNDGDATDLFVDSIGSLLSSLATTIAGEDITAEILKTEEQGQYTNLTASALIKTGRGRVFGVVVNSHTSGTMKLWDNTSAATTVLVNTFTFAAGSQVIKFPAAIKFNTGLYYTVGGTQDVSVIWE